MASKKAKLLIGTGGALTAAFLFASTYVPQSENTGMLISMAGATGGTLQRVELVDVQKFEEWNAFETPRIKLDVKSLNLKFDDLKMGEWYTATSDETLLQGFIRNLFQAPPEGFSHTAREADSIKHAPHP